jgi:hypothetical protein
MVVVGMLLISGTVMYFQWSLEEYRKEQVLFDTAEDIVKQVNSLDYLRAVNSTGSDYDYLVLSKPALEWYLDHPGRFEGNITSEYRYRIVFDDLNVSDVDHNPGLNMSSKYRFGGEPPWDAEVATLKVHYCLHLDLTHIGHAYELVRHVCMMTVEVWR